jgi:homoserine dehydrogenase
MPADTAVAGLKQKSLLMKKTIGLDRKDTMASQKEIGVGIAGVGTIGTGVVKKLSRDTIFEREANLKLKLERIVDKRAERNVFGCPFSTDFDSIINDPKIDIVVELMGGYDPSYEFIKSALEKGKTVVTANKAVIDRYGKELDELAIKNKTYLFFEASVGGGIPIISAIEIGMIGNSTDSLIGILNGTTNYILTRMSEGSTYEAALKEAQAEGFAEANPAFDVQGKDAAQKLAILASLNFDCKVSSEQVHTEGITGITREDIAFAAELGYEVKLLAIARRYKDQLELRVHPTMISKSHPLAAINRNINAIYLSGDAHNMLSGEGAGRKPTAGAVMSDIKNAAKALQKEYSPNKHFGENVFKIRKAKEINSEFYLNFSGSDEPGTLRELAGVLAEEKINISQVRQIAKKRGDYVPIVVMTDLTNQATIESAIKKITETGKRLRFNSAIRVGLNESEETTQIFFAEQTKEMIRETLGPIDIENYNGDILVADLKSGEITKLCEKFALGKIGIWKTKEGKIRSFIKVSNHPNYPKGIYMSTYSKEEVKEKGKRTIDEKIPGAHRIELPKNEDPIQGAFASYKDPIPLVLHK